MSPARKILIISITRLGDIIQSIPFVKRMRLKYPAAEIHMLVEECFAEVAAFLPGVDQLHYVRLEDLLPDLSTGNQHNLPKAADYYNNLVSLLGNERYNEIWNLTHTRPAMMLNHLLAGAEGLGVTLDDRGRQRINSQWLTYFFAANLARPWCQFNLVDIYANCVTEIPWSFGRDMIIEQRHYDSHVSHYKRDPQMRYRVALHCGASQTIKQWPVESFREVARALLEHANLEIVLVGSRKDLPLAKHFNDLPRIANYIGQTTISELAALLSTCDLLISNDSGPMHVAAAVGIKVIDITVGSALGSETAPYGEGHLVIEPSASCFPCLASYKCSHQRCAHTIVTAAVSALAEWKLGLRSNISPDVFTDCRVYQTQISKDDSMIELKRIFGTAADLRDDLNQMLRPYWISALENRSPTMQGIKYVSPALQNSAQLVNALINRLLSLADTLEAAAQKNPQPIKEILRLGQEIADVEGRVSAIISRESILNSILVFGNLRRGSLTEGSLVNQARETATIYRQLGILLMPFLPPSTENHLFVKNTVREVPCESR
jgi:ADP-heptose:LPS heptosyltransferase